MRSRRFKFFTPTYESLNHQLLYSSETLPTYFSNYSIGPQIEPLCSTTVLTLHLNTIFPILLPLTKWKWWCCLRKISQCNNTFIVCISPPRILHTASASTDMFFCIFFTLRDNNFYNKIVRQNTRFLRSTLQPNFLVAHTPAVENFCMYFMVHQAPTIISSFHTRWEPGSTVSIVTRLRAGWRRSPGSIHAMGKSFLSFKASSKLKRWMLIHKASAALWLITSQLPVSGVKMAQRLPEFRRQSSPFQGATSVHLTQFAFRT